MEDKENLLNKVLNDSVNILSRNSIVFAYLYGSLSKGNFGRLSDIDIAVYVDKSLNKYERFNLRIKLMKELGKKLKTDAIDILILNDAYPLIKHRVLKEGRLIFCKEKDRLIDFEVKTIMEYLDFLPFIKKHTKEIMYDRQR